MGTLPEHLEVLLDLQGSRIGCRCESLEMSANLVRTAVAGPPGAENATRLKHALSVDFEPIVFYFNSGIGVGVSDWIRTTFASKVDRRDGRIIVLSGGKTKSVVSFYEALLTEVTIPKVDATAKQPAQLRVKIQPERATWERPNFNPRDAIKYGPPSAPAWTKGGFRLSIDGLKQECAAVKVLEPLTLTQGVKSDFRGAGTLRSIEPQKLRQSNLALTLPTAALGRFNDWFNDSVSIKRSNTKNGSLVYLSASAAQPRMNLELVGLGPASLQPNTAGLPSTRIELFIERINLVNP